MRLILLFLFFVSISSADSIGLPGGSPISGLAGGAIRFQRDNAGQVPKSLEDLEPYLDMERVMRKADQFTWLDSPVTFPSGQILAVTNYKVLEDRRDVLGRYALYVNSEIKVHSGWFPEDELTFAFEASGQRAPDDGLFIQPVSDWSKFPEYLSRMPADRREGFLKEVERKYELTVRNGEIVTLDSLKNQINEPTESTEEVVETPGSLPENENSTQVRFPEPSTEPVKQLSQWWLWLIGAVVVLGGLGLVLRRKS